ncbi:hypothetical protein HRI_002005600 [Hibiscus trionum]|uniref:Reverse transcriptase domain-containing protein n=1 Tax=Hibiscus trionum TaxID=183268 RepID=A0A9W7HV89_HIBTR|nr:hypothetical protein HRI_002005600 [Hibiscus trionum]
MPFGLTNAPATFQALMNKLFEPYLRKFVLVFFDDILIYNKDMREHEGHVRIVLKVLRENKLFAKRKKCFFGQRYVEYLGHIITEQGVATDPSKIEAMKNWALPTNLKSLMDFLGLTGYYRRFIRDYGTISKPLTNMLKKEGFSWSEEFRKAFELLKKVMCKAHVLALPNFNKAFYLETDASARGTGVVLTQEGRPIAYLSKVIGPKNVDLSIYEKE